MTQATLNYQDRKEVVKYRLEKAQVTYRDALIGIDNGSVGIAANRLYYAAYYAVSAMLIANGITTRLHDGVRRMLGLHFLKNHLLTMEDGKTFNLLYSLRLTGDYQDRKNLDMDKDVKPLVKPAKELIHKVSEMAREKMMNCET